MQQPESTGVATKLRRTPLGAQLAAVIRNDILFGRLKAGDPISQQDLCERYGTSRMPVRDALRRLIYEGFVLEHGSRAEVAPFTRADLEDIYLIEGMLHGLSARRVTERGDRTEIAELVGYHEAMLAGAETCETSAIADLNWRFHCRINKLAGSRKLIAVIRTHSLAIPRDYLRELPHWIRRANEQHAHVVDAMAHGRAAEAERLMTQHVVDAGADLVAYLQARGVALD